ncbi:hypothetical protein [Leifsonia virtsii]|uniref:DUF4345 domain-containing protein n=1 Tax=Leifsonia virtsii TaxID=3035915 RepID=A0ABT8IVF2_9MICO|nr:hypothetical protein [Leifsonia virtsii]MDN4596796.1 hypothetical protein [Leifsonia virtsii]
MKRWIRITLTVLTGAVGLTAVAGGLALLVAALTSTNGGGVTPDRSYLGGSPFTSYIVPGLVLAVVVGGTHILAAVLTGRGSQAGPFAAAVAGFGLLIWIFVQMMFIPFSPLQAIYFLAGLAELGLVLLGLGLFRRRAVAAS